MFSQYLISSLKHKSSSLTAEGSMCQQVIITEIMSLSEYVKRKPCQLVK